MRGSLLAAFIAVFAVVYGFSSRTFAQLPTQAVPMFFATGKAVACCNNPGAVNFDTHSYLVTSHGLIGLNGSTLAASPYGTCFVRMRGSANQGGGDWNEISQGTSSSVSETTAVPGGFLFGQPDNSADNPYGRLRNNMGDGVSKVLTVNSTSTAASPYVSDPLDVWYTRAYSVNTNFSAGNKRFRIYNGLTNITSNFTSTDSSAAFSVNFNNLAYVNLFGSTLYSYTEHYGSIDVSDFTCDFGTVDWTTSSGINQQLLNRANQLNSDGTPAIWGRNCSTLWGYQPIICLHADPTQPWGHNWGYGGEFYTQQTSLQIGGSFGTGHVITITYGSGANGCAAALPFTVSYTTTSSDSSAAALTTDLVTAVDAQAPDGMWAQSALSGQSTSILSLFQPATCYGALAVSFSSTGSETGTLAKPQGGAPTPAPTGPNVPTHIATRTWAMLNGPFSSNVGSNNKASGTIGCGSTTHVVNSGDMLICLISAYNGSSGDPGTISAANEYGATWNLLQGAYNAFSSHNQRFAVFEKIANSTDAACSYAVLTGVTISGTTVSYTGVTGQVCQHQKLDWAGNACGSVSDPKTSYVVGSISNPTGAGTFTINNSETISTSCTMLLFGQYFFNWTSSSGENAVLLDYANACSIDTSAYNVNSTSSTTIAVPSLSLTDINDTVLAVGMPFESIWPFIKYPSPLLLETESYSSSVATPEIWVGDAVYANSFAGLNLTNGEATTGFAIAIAIGHC